MISLKEYRFLFLEDSYSIQSRQSPFSKQQLPFNYLYPSQTQNLEKLFTNQNQEQYIVTKLQNFQQCEKLNELFISKTKIFAPCQDIFLVENKNKNSQKRFLVISSFCPLNSLKKIAQNYFFQGIVVPSQVFCTRLIEGVLKFCKQFEEKGLCLNILTLQSIIIYQEQIYLNYPLPTDIFTKEGKCYQQLQKHQYFCAPQILKILSSYRDVEKKQSEVSTKNSFDPALNLQKYFHKNDEKQCKKAVLYSLGLCIFSCFKFQIAIEDRYQALKNPKYINKRMKQLRKQIKTHHQGKYISKLMKLMLEHSESLRDTLSTFSYKMQSVQFKLLKKPINPNKNIFSQQNIPTQSEVNSQPFLISNSGKKTIDIRISSLSNASSINRSWISISHQTLQKNLSPLQINKFNISSDQKNQKSNKSITRDLNEIQQKKQIGSPIQFQIQWDQESYGRNSNKSNRQQQNKYSISSQKDKKQTKSKTLLNKISEKQEGQQIEESDQKIKNIVIGDNQLENKDEIQKREIISKTQTGKNTQNQLNQEIKLQNKIKEHNFLFNSEKKINNLKIEEQQQDIDEQFHFSQISTNSERSVQYKNHNINQNIDIENSNTQNMQSQKVIQIQVKEAQNKYKPNEQNHRRLQLLKNRNNCQENDLKQSNELFFVDMNSNINLKIGKQETNAQNTINYDFLQNFQLGLNKNMSNSNPQFNITEPQNQSYIFQNPLNNQEYKIEQNLLKQNKKKEKQKITERKKDQYNQRSKIILFTLVMIYCIFQLMDYIIGKI